MQYCFILETNISFHPTSCFPVLVYQRFFSVKSTGLKTFRLFECTNFRFDFRQTQFTIILNFAHDPIWAKIFLCQSSPLKILIKHNVSNFKIFTTLCTKFLVVIHLLSTFGLFCPLCYEPFKNLWMTRQVVVKQSSLITFSTEETSCINKRNILM